MRLNWNDGSGPIGVRKQLERQNVVNTATNQTLVVDTQLRFARSGFFSCYTQNRL